MDYAKIARKLREQMVRFSGELSAGCPKVVRRFIAEMVFGIQARGSVRLTEVARALSEPIAIKKTEWRLSRALSRPGLEASVQSRLLRMGANRIQDDTLLILDLSDTSKKYAKKMEYLAQVWDGSEKEVTRGYWTLNVVGASAAKTEIVPLYGRLFSQLAPEHRSENEEIRRAVTQVAEACQKRGVWVMDRGGDRDYIHHYLLDSKLSYLVRLRADRGLRAPGEKASALEFARRCPVLFYETIVREDKGRERLVRLGCGLRKVRLPGRPEDLTLVVVRGFGKEPLMILTNLPVRRSRRSLWHVIESYMTRWRIEETIRFVKQSYHLEDVRCLKYRRLQALMALVTAVAYFAAAYLGLRTKLRVLSGHLIRASRRLFGIPNFRSYAVADGIRNFLFSQTKGISGLLAPPPPVPLQPGLFDS